MDTNVDLLSRYSEYRAADAAKTQTASAAAAAKAAHDAASQKAAEAAQAEAAAKAVLDAANSSDATSDQRLAASKRSLIDGMGAGTLHTFDNGNTAFMAVPNPDNPSELLLHQLEVYHHS